MKNLLLSLVLLSSCGYLCPEAEPATFYTQEIVLNSDMYTTHNIPIITEKGDTVFVRIRTNCDRRARVMY